MQPEALRGRDKAPGLPMSDRSWLKHSRRLGGAWRQQERWIQLPKALEGQITSTSVRGSRGECVIWYGDGARSQTRSQREAAGRNGFISNRKQQIRIIEKKKTHNRQPSKDKGAKRSQKESGKQLKSQCWDFPTLTSFPRPSRAVQLPFLARGEVDAPDPQLWFSRAWPRAVKLAPCVSWAWEKPPRCCSHSGLGHGEGWWSSGAAVGARQCIILRNKWQCPKP